MLNLSRRDWLISIMISLTLIASSWLFGGMPNWTKVTLYSLALGSFLALFVPLGNEINSTVTFKSASVKTNLKKLLRFPVFWLGVLLFAYILLQWSNPSHRYYVDRELGAWYLVDHSVTPNERMPTCIDAPYHMGNPKNYLLKWGSAWLFVCAAWVGIRSQRMLNFIFVSFAISSLFLVLVAIIQKFQNQPYILWTYPWNNEGLGSFLYRNHGAAFFNLSMAVNAFLGLYFLKKSIRKSEGSSPFFIFLLIFFLFVIAVILSYSRGGWIIGLFTILAFLWVCLWFFFTYRNKTQNKKLGLFLMIIIGGICFGALQKVEIQDWVKARFIDLVDLTKGSKEIEMDARFSANQATWDMFLDRKLFGWGASSFRLVFPRYMGNYEVLVKKDKKGNYRTHWEHAHNDPLQFLAELGIVGSSILISIFIFFLFSWVIRFKQLDLPSNMLIVAIFGLLAHSFIDFVFSSTSIIYAWTFLLVALSKYLSFRKNKTKVNRYNIPNNWLVKT